MCGIAGFAVASGKVTGSDVDAVTRMTARMRARGPDAEGQWVGEGIVLGHRRLAILDLDARAIQPMAWDDGRYRIVFNGEIYNFRQLRKALEGEGVVFRTQSDTEVLLALFAREGEAMLSRLRGMFAFAIWDARSHELFLARDPYGIKQVYYASTRDGVVFASQVKALLASRRVPAVPEPAGWAGFFLWGSVPEPWTVVRDIFALPAGHWLRVRSGVVMNPVCWHDIRTHWQGERCEISPHELSERVRQAVRDSVQAHLVADVPVSVFLSGGVDSGAIAGMAVDAGAKLEGITVCFTEFAGLADDEADVARATAQRYGLRHHVRLVSCTEFEQDIPAILDAMDQPSIDGVNTWFASKAVAERGYKVVLSGVGGDELFCGYPSFRQVPSMAAVGAVIGHIPGVQPVLRAACAALAKRGGRPKLAALPQFMTTLEGAYFLRRALFLPTELPALMGMENACDGIGRLGGDLPQLIRTSARDGVSSVAALESTIYLKNQLLRDSDWASMAHSLELRTPLVDATLLEALAPYICRFKGGAGKSMLASSPCVRLPEAVLYRPKTGFGVPMASWLNTRTTASVGRTKYLGAGLAPPSRWSRRWAMNVANAAAAWG
jgi:asparagine synthase (glutamine-hydrolysing)